MVIGRAKLKSSRQTITLGKALGGGGAQGEGVLHATNSGLLIKRFHDDHLPLSPEFLDKITELKLKLPVPSRDGYRFVAPQDITLDPITDEPNGYVMEFIADSVDLAEVGRTEWLPMEFRYEVLKNLSAALLDLHQVEIYRGDFLNSLVCRDGSVAEIDLDSVQLGTEHRCEFVKPLYTAPEWMQAWQSGDDVIDIDITADSDRYAFGLQAYYVLTGDHPFRSKYTGSSKKLNKLQLVAEGIFPWSGRHPDYGPPKDGQFDELHPDIQGLLLQTFEDGHLDVSARPTLEQWHDAFRRLA